jgi:hypothetical protein
MPVSVDRAGRLRLHVPRHACWTGTIVVYQPARYMLPNYDPYYSIYWGELFVYGDPVLIERLTGIRPIAAGSNQ